MIRPPFVDASTTIPYMDWGYGLSPQYRDRTYSMCALAWGKVVQLVILTDVDDEENCLIPDGYYVSDHVVDSIYFLSESLIFILVNGREVRILHTQHFAPGECGDDAGGSMDETRSTSSIISTNSLKEKRAHMSLIAEMEKGHELLNGDIIHRDIPSAIY